MATRPKIQLSRLRDIGWSLWDPIGLRDVEGWKDGSGADEYDRYLIRVVSILRNGGTEEECRDYLLHIEAEHMGMGLRGDSRRRADETVAAIAEYMTSLPGEPLGLR